MMTPVSIGVVGVGHRGQRYANAFGGLRNCEVKWFCDTDAESCEAAKRFAGATATATRSLETVLADESLDAVVITTPLAERGDQARSALASDKHVLVDGPLSMAADDIVDLTTYARGRALCLLISNRQIFDPALRKLKESVETGRLGEMLYLYGNSQGLETVGGDGDTLSSPGARDVAALLYLLDDTPVTVSACGESYLRRGSPDVTFCYLRFANGVTAHLHLSRLDPQTVRRLTLVGTRQMAVYNHDAAMRELTLFAHSIPPMRGNGSGVGATIQLGEALSPVVRPVDTVMLECESFLAAVRKGRPLEAEARLAVNVASVLDALRDSLALGGAAQPVAPPVTQLRNVVAFRRVPSPLPAT